MANYNNDRSFTDYVQKNVSIPTIYPIMGWKEGEIDAAELERIDIHHGIDAVILDKNSNQKTLQYRYRDAYYKDNTDTTLRYQRPHNSNQDRHESEFFKIEADYLLYGISNGKKFDDKLGTNTNFLKWAVIDLHQLFNLINEGLIIIDPLLRGYKCALNENKMICPVLNNKDRSSNFVPFDVLIMQNLFGNTGVIVNSHGF